MTKMGATFGFTFALVLLFVSFDIISSVPSTSGGYNVSTNQGFAQITTTDVKFRPLPQGRVCEEWKKQEVTGRWKCVKFIVTTTK